MGVFQDYVAPIIVDVLVRCSLKNHQLFAIQFIVNRIAQSVVMESESTLMKTATASHLSTCYLMQFVSVIKAIGMGNSTFNRSLDICGFAYIGISWILELVLGGAQEQFHSSSSRVMRASLILMWVMLSLKMSMYSFVI